MLHAVKCHCQYLCLGRQHLAHPTLSSPTDLRSPPLPKARIQDLYSCDFRRVGAVTHRGMFPAMLVKDTWQMMGTMLGRSSRSKPGTVGSSCFRRRHSKPVTESTTTGG
jgi:hypothetical protein